MLGVDGDDLLQAFFALGIVGRDRGEPQPGVLVARLGNQHQVEHLAGLVTQATLRGQDRLSQQFFRAHAWSQPCKGRLQQMKRLRDKYSTFHAENIPRDSSCQMCGDNGSSA